MLGFYPVTIMVASLNDIADDVVVRELDVYLCRPDLGSETQVKQTGLPLQLKKIYID